MKKTRPRIYTGALKIALLYAGFSSLWILFSDQVLFIMVRQPHLITRIQMVKGWVFVLVTAGLIFFLLQREIRQYVTVQSRLKESEETHRGLFESSPVALYLQDFSGAEKEVQTLFPAGFDGKSEGVSDFLATHPEAVDRLAMSVRMIRANQAAVDLYGAGSGDELLERGYKLLVRDDRRHFIDQILLFTEGRDHYEGKARNYNLRGEILHLIIQKTVINRNKNGLSRILVSVVDVTQLHKAHKEREKLESQLQQNHKMQAIGTLAGGIAHDFNNILSGIFGYSQLALRHLDAPEKAEKDINQVIRAAEKAADLVQQILTFSRKSPDQKKPLAVHAVIKDALKLLRASIPANVEIRETIVSRSKMMADPTKIHQILMNLCTNAYHAMLDSGGVLAVGLDEVTLPETDAVANLGPGRYLRLTVSDTGHGIDRLTREKIFEPYFTTKSPEKGTGLGLAVVFGIVKEHNGHISVDSEPGRGTTFRIYFPKIDHSLPEKTWTSRSSAGGSQS